jgi:hypothetical protein
MVPAEVGNMGVAVVVYWVGYAGGGGRIVRAPRRAYADDLVL